MDRFAAYRNGLRRLAGLAGEWAGIPMALEDETLHIAPGYPFAEVLQPPKDAPTAEDEGITLINRWWSTRRRAWAVIYEEDGKRHGAYLPGGSPVTHMLRTLGCSYAWGIEQEQAALKVLGRMIRHHKFKTYLLTGMFLETSKRSGVSYVFRRLRPTIAMSARNGEEMQVIATLCMHPIGYYEDSWAGAMCPTDDVVAHLTLMRGDEHMFWKRCNQHHASAAESGIWA